jgi:acyl-coenzyme A synthetase/AMP-(fatty) acid ligase
MTPRALESPADVNLADRLVARKVREGRGAKTALLYRGDRSCSSAPATYWNDPERTRRSLRADGWVVTGDLFRHDEQGYLYFCGRADEMIKAGWGEWVSADVDLFPDGAQATVAALAKGMRAPC